MGLLSSPDLAVHIEMLTVYYTWGFGHAALMYNAVNSTIDAVRGEHDFYGGMAAAAISGAIFKSTGESALVSG